MDTTDWGSFGGIKLSTSISESGLYYGHVLLYVPVRKILIYAD